MLNTQNNTIYEQWNTKWLVYKPWTTTSNRFRITTEIAKEIPSECLPIFDIQYYKKYICIPPINIENKNMTPSKYKYQEKVIYENPEELQIIKTIQNHIICGLDGSYLDGQGAYEACISTSDQVLLYSGGGKCYTHFIVRSPYEEEVQGSLSLTYNLMKYSMTIHPNSIIHIYIDNESVVKEFFELYN